MSLAPPSIKLSNGVDIPALAYGVGSKWSRAKKATPNETDMVLALSITRALQKGFIHLDLAETYNTYLEVKVAFDSLRQDAKFNRDDIFITDKYWTGLGSGNMPKTLSPKESLERSLKTLGVDSVDLYLIHSPFMEKEHHGLSTEEAWKEIEELYESGKAKAIGVSNFDVANLEELFQYAKHKPMLNQIEYNLYLPNQSPGIINFCKQNNIAVSLYSPLAPLYKKSLDEEENSKKGPIDDYVEELAAKYGKTNTQILLKWVYQTGVIPVTTSQSEERMDQILNIWDFELTNEELTELSQLGSKHFFRQYWLLPYGKYDSILTKL